MIEAQDYLLGPVSQVLEAELRAVIRKHGVLVWLDLDDHYSGFVDRRQRHPSPRRTPGVD